MGAPNCSPKTYINMWSMLEDMWDDVNRRKEQIIFPSSSSWVPYCVCFHVVDLHLFPVTIEIEHAIKKQVVNSLKFQLHQIPPKILTQKLLCFLCTRFCFKILLPSTKKYLTLLLCLEAAEILVFFPANFFRMPVNQSRFENHHKMPGIGAWWHMFHWWSQGLGR